MKYRWWKAVNLALMSALMATVVSALVQPALPVAASPAGLIFHSGFESGDFAEWNSAPGTTSVQSTIKWTGDYAMRVNPTSFHGFANATGSPYRSTVYLCVEDDPDRACSILGAEGGIHVGLSSSMTLYLDDGDETVTGGTTLVTSTWYRISLSLDAANHTAKAYLDGVEECSSTTVTGTSLSNWLGPQSDVTADLYFDDYASDDIESTNDIGNIRVLRSQPNAMGTYTGEWQQVPASTNHYEKIDECPSDDADYTWADADFGEQLDESYGLQDCSDIGLTTKDTVRAVSIWWRYNTGGGGETEYASIVSDDGADYYDWTIGDPTSATWLNRYYSDMPNGGAAWTQARFDALEVGMATNDKNKDMWLYCLMVMVAYTVPAWNSYTGGFPNDSGTREDFFADYPDDNIIYMYGTGFGSAINYRVWFWDGSGELRGPVDTSSDSSGNLSVAYTLNPSTDIEGNWRCSVYDDQTYTPTSYDPNDTKMVADDTSYTNGYAFYVTAAAIPEFPTVLAGIVAMCLCAGIYLWMRKRRIPRVKA